MMKGLSVLAEAGHVDEADPVFPDLVSRAPALLSERADVIFGSRRMWAQQLEEIGDYAIRDWSRPPYGAGCHAWKPGVESWEVRKRLASFGFDAGGSRNLHVCGEAYSDYQGFIEGALRSAADACNAILRGDGAESGDLVAKT